MLNYIEKNLNANEVIVYKAKRSLVLMVKPVLCALAVLAAGMMFGGNQDGSILLACVLLAIGIVGVNWIMLRERELVVTNRRIMSKSGIIRKSLQDCPLDKVDTVQAENGILGSILGYGRIVVTAINGTFNFDHVVHPAQFRNRVMEAIEAGKDAERILQAQRLAEAMRMAATAQR